MSDRPSALVSRSSWKGRASTQVIAAGQGPGPAPPLPPVPPAALPPELPEAPPDAPAPLPLPFVAPPAAPLPLPPAPSPSSVSVSSPLHAAVHASNDARTICQGEATARRVARSR